MGREVGTGLQRQVVSEREVIRGIKVGLMNYIEDDISDSEFNSNTRLRDILGDSPIGYVGAALSLGGHIESSYGIPLQELSESDFDKMTIEEAARSIYENLNSIKRSR